MFIGWAVIDLKLSLLGRLGPHECFRYFFNAGYLAIRKKGFTSFPSIIAKMVRKGTSFKKIRA